MKSFKYQTRVDLDHVGEDFWNTLRQTIQGQLIENKIDTREPLSEKELVHLKSAIGPTLKSPIIIEEIV